ncbi:xenotropic and polytropic retrovirus receptor 1-like [Centruroides sculpturatus]|uniref:xenotropic and polytropic retrovirus receptor 1-like n=2 Tax=Centruroides sculpturatus TaxID=218467 RepID=UPI000C6D72F6|nr:xenotropic and polytropic retrovirus receptor 1-like [Centruroides sculpturatus]
MKFAEHLGAHITPEWRKQYIQYEEMKAMCYSAIERAPSPEVVEQSVITRYFASFEEEFFHHCEKELTKINTFYSEKMAEATRKFGNLKTELNNYNCRVPNAKGSWKHFEEKKSTLRIKGLNREADKQVRTHTRKMHELKLAFSEFYLSLILLQNYQNLNFTGFRKILKKHDKLLGTDAGAKWRQAHVEIAPFYVNKFIDKLIQETESLVTTDLEGGDRQRAMKRLRVPPLNDKQSPWTTFKVGLFSGAFIVLVVAVILSATFSKARDDWRIVFRLYRGTLLIILFMFLIGINVYGWRTSGVNHVLIFELDPRNHLSEQHLMEMAAIFGVMWALSVLAFLYSNHLSILAYANPLILVVVMLVFLFNPTRTMRYQARFWLLKVLGKVIAAPFFHVGFADFWLADQLNSLVPVLVDFEYFLCFYITGIDWSENNDSEKCVKEQVGMILRPVVACLPAWFRFAQCLRRYRDTKEGFPHLVNAGKYSTTFFVVIFSTLFNTFKDDYEESEYNPYFFLWIIFALISSCYTYVWDIKMDWGLFECFSGDNKFLREEIVYSSPGYYYFAVIEDFVLRFGWTLSVSLTEMGVIHTDLMVSILAPLEVFRRFVWNFFRLENEHLNNCGKFRAVRDISVAPIDSNDQALIIKMMDEENGVVNRKRKDKKKLMKRKKSSDAKVLLLESTGNDTDHEF